MNLNAGANTSLLSIRDPEDGVVKDLSLRNLTNQERRFKEAEARGPSPMSSPCLEAHRPLWAAVFIMKP